MATTDRIIPFSQVKLRYTTEPEARAAAEALDSMIRAANAHADVYLQGRTLAKIRAEQAQDSSGYFFYVDSTFVFTSPFGGQPVMNAMAPELNAVSLLAPPRPEPSMTTLAGMPPGVTHIMIDLETLGRKRGCQVLSLGAVEFGPSGLGAEFSVVFERTSQSERGLTVEPETREWWGRQSAEARARVFEAPQTETGAALLDLETWLNKTSFYKQRRLWANGADFDLPILEDLYTAYSLTTPWVFYNARCYRMLKNLRRKIGMDRVGVAHNALDDAKSQAAHAVKLLSALDAWGDV
jgi:3' exoribonuclease, RNase T-like